MNRSLPVLLLCPLSLDSLLGGSPGCCRFFEGGEEAFEETNSMLKRGDIIGVTGCPGIVGKLSAVTLVHRAR